MEIVIWVLIVILFILSFVGIIVPVIPGVVLIWLSFIIYNFGIEPITSWYFWTSMVVITIITIVIDYLASTTLVKKWGGTKSSMWAAIVGLLIGPFIMWPVGIIIVPFLFVVIVELIRGVPIKKALKVGFATFIGFLGSSVIKAILFLTMIITFFIKVFFG